MQSYQPKHNFRALKDHLIDVILTVYDLNDHSMTIPTNRFLLSSFSEYFRVMFISGFKQTMTSASIYQVEIKDIIDLSLFSEIIGALYDGNLADIIFNKDNCGKQLDMLSICNYLHINIPYLGILKNIKIESECFQYFVAFLESIGENIESEEMVEFLSARMSTEELDLVPQTVALKVVDQMQKKLLLGTTYGYIEVINHERPQKIVRMKIADQGITTAMFSPNMSQVACVIDRQVFVVDIRTPSFLFTESFTLDSNAYIVSLAYSPDSSRILTSSSNKIVQWDAITGGILLEINTIDYRNAMFLANGSRIASLSSIFDHSSIQIFDAYTGQMVVRRNFDFEINSIAQAADGSLAADRGDAVLFLSIDALEQTRGNLQTFGKSSGMKFSNDNRYLFCFEDAYHLIITRYDLLNDSHKRLTLETQANEITIADIDISAHSDAVYILLDGMVIIYDWDLEEELGVLRLDYVSYGEYSCISAPHYI